MSQLPSQLYFSILLDKIIFLQEFQLADLNWWLKNFLLSQEKLLFIQYNPELLFIFENTVFNFFLKSNYLTLAFNNTTLNTILPLATLNFLNLVLLIVIISFFVIMYYSTFSTPTKEENAVDIDQFIMSATIECEEEYGALDDIMQAFIILFFLFGWFFNTTVVFIIETLPELSILYYILPFLYYLILGIPTLLLYDFGLYFITYLRGVGPSSVLFVELLFDYIAVVAFYIRLSVQSVRLVLILGVFYELSEVIIFTWVDQRLIFGTETLWDDVTKLSSTVHSVSYFLLLKLPGHIIYWLYELVHTLFVLTAQTIAFFAMSFWLFLFLFSFFTSEAHETYLSFKRQNLKESNVYAKILTKKIN